MYSGIVLCFVAFLAAFQLQTTFGLFDVALTKVEPIHLNDTKYVDFRKLLLRKINRTHIIIGSFETFMDADNDYEILGLLNRKIGNQYQRLPYKIGPKPFCTFWDEAHIFMPEVRKVSNLPAKGVCPWVTNLYKIDGYEVNMEKAPKVMESGMYMAEIFITKNGNLLNGIRIHGIAEVV